VPTKRKGTPFLWLAFIASCGVAVWLYSKRTAVVAPAGEDLSKPLVTHSDSSSQPLLPASFTKDRPFVNSLGMKFVPIPGSEAFMCVHETRRSDYAAYAEANQGVDDAWKTVIGEADHPVVKVSWEQATSFCAWLAQKDSIVCRLPTDREWSVVAGIADMEDPKAYPENLHEKAPGYSWGDTWPPSARCGNFADLTHRAKTQKSLIIEGYDDGHAETSPVMSYPPNKLGIYDLGGNVTEWVGGWHDAAQTKRTARDSCWNDATRVDFLLSKRRPLMPDYSSNRLGFRVVIVPTVAQVEAQKAVTAPSTPALPPKPPLALSPDQQKADAVWRSRWSKPGRLKLHTEGVTSPVSVAAAEGHDDIVQVAGVAPGTNPGVFARWTAVTSTGEIITTNLKLTAGQRYIGVVMGYNSAPDVLIREGGLPEARGLLLTEKPVLQVRAFRMAALLGLPETSQDAEVYAFQNTDGSWFLKGTPVEKKLLLLPDLSSDRSIRNITLSQLGVAVVRSDGTSSLYGKTEAALPPALFTNVKEVRFGKHSWYALGKNGVLTYLKVSSSGVPDYAGPSVFSDVAEFFGGHMGDYWRMTSGLWAAHTPDLPMMNKLNELNPDFFFLALGANGDLLFWIEPK
jgi:hypothetical protein